MFDLEQTVAERLARMQQFGEPIAVYIRDLPIKPYTRFRQRYFELGRELRLLSLAHGHDYPIARQLTEAFLETEQERRRMQGRHELQVALESGRERADLDFLIPATMPDTMSRLLTALERADEFCRQQRLLTIAASPQQRELQRWWCMEFVRQGRGEEPMPWPGSFEVEEDPLPT